MTTPLQSWEIVDLPLHRLLAVGRRVEKSSCHRSARVAVLADAASQHYCLALSAILKLRGVWPEIYEAEFDMIQQEILDPESGLYRSSPDFVVLFTAVQALHTRFASTPNKRAFADDILSELTQLWAAFRTHSNAVLILIFPR